MNDKPEKMPPVPPFVRFVASAVPMVFDNSLSYYEALCALWKYLQNMSDVVNNNATLEEEFIDKVKELETYVNTYFDNLDVQDEINNKLDAMVESGEFDTILANYLVISGGNAKALGCAGDGVTDDTTAINLAIQSLESTSIRKIVFPEGNYAVSGAIEVPSDFTVECMPNAVIKYVGDGKEGSIFDIEGESYLSPVENVRLINVNIDGTGQVYKGGASDATPAVTSTSPKYRGLHAIYVKWGKRVEIKGCNIKDVYGNGIYATRSCIVSINDNYLEDCSGGNPRAGGDSGYDNFGDGIRCFGCWGCNIEGNTIINKRVYLASSTGSDVGTICGRSGLEYEYGMTQDSVYCVDYDLFNTTEGQGLRCINNFVYGYVKGAHFESDVKVLFNENTVIKCQLGCLFSVDGESECCNNYFADDTAGTPIQGGYDLYKGAIILTEYNNLITRKFVISGNIIHSTNNFGVSIAKNDVIINGNYFYNCGIQTITSPSDNNIVTNNNFYNGSISCYDNNNWKIDHNTFNCPTKYTIRIAGGCKKHQITNNIVDNSIYIEGTTEDITIEGNSFLSKSSIATLNNDNAFISSFKTSINIVDNLFDMTNNDTALCWISKSDVYKLILRRNVFRFNATRSTNPISMGSGATNINIFENYIYGLDDGLQFIRHTWNATNVSIKDNYSDNQMAYIYYQSNGGVNGIYKIEHNIGALRFANVPNNALTKFVNYYLTQGEVIDNYSNAASTGWKVTRSGIYTTTAYADGAVTKGQYVISNTDYVYKAQSAGTASVAPSGTTTGNTETGADGITWYCCGKVATLSAL